MKKRRQDDKKSRILRRAKHWLQEFVVTTGETIEYAMPTIAFRLGVMTSILMFLAVFSRMKM